MMELLLKHTHSELKMNITDFENGIIYVSFLFERELTILNFSNFNEEIRFQIIPSRPKVKNSLLHLNANFLT